MALYFLPLISAFIGWFTNWVAIKMLFHPKEPKKILGFTLQGIFPKRQKQFAAKLGMTVSKELLHFDDIGKQLSRPENVALLKPVIEQHIRGYIEEKLPAKFPFLSMLAGSGTIEKLFDGLMEELEKLLPVLMEQYAGKLGEHIDIEKMVTEKVENFSSDKLEEILFQIMSKEFRFVEIIGGVLGFLIGLMQVLLTKLA